MRKCNASFVARRQKRNDSDPCDGMDGTARYAQKCARRWPRGRNIHVWGRHDQGR